MVQDFNTTPDVINLTLSFYALGTAVFVLFADILISRYGRRPIMLFSVAIFSLSSLSISVFPWISGIIILRVIQSVGLALNIIASTMIIKDIFKVREQIRAMGFILGGLVISPAISPVIGAYLAYYFGWRSCFAFSGTLGAIFVIVVYKTLPETNSHGLKKLPKMWPYLLRYFMVLKSPFLVYLTVLFSCGLGAFFVFIGISSYLFINNFKISPIAYSYLYVFLAAAFLGGNCYLQHLNRKRLSCTRILGIGSYIILFGAFFLIIAQFISPSFLVLSIIVAGVVMMRFANAIVNPTVQVLIVNYSKKRGGIALGMAMSLGLGTQGVSIIVVTLFHDNPLRGLIIISVILSLIGVIMFHLVSARSAHNLLDNK